MLKVYKKSFESNCRTCLSSTDLEILSEKHLINIIKECSSIKEMNYINPKMLICRTCRVTLDSFCEFKRRLAEIDQLIHSTYSESVDTKCLKEANAELTSYEHELHPSLTIKEEMGDFYDRDFEDFPDISIKTQEKTHSCVKTSAKLSEDRKTTNTPDDSVTHQSLSCSLCTKSFTLQRSLKYHIFSAHKGIKPYKCVECDADFAELNKLVKHTRQRHNATPKLKCDKCDDTFYVCEELEKHVARVHFDRKCVHCGKIYKKLKNLKDHIYNVHKVRVPFFHCDECDRAFTKRKPYEQHMLCHRGVDLRKMCNICGKKYRNVNDHVNSVHRKGEIIYKCRRCDATYTDVIAFRKHTKTHRVAQPKTDDATTYKYNCTLCERRYTTKLNLVRHVKIVHENTLRFSCEACNKHYKQKKDYVVHMRRHTGERPFECETCKMTFTNRDTLRAHVRTHTGERPYECKVCLERFMHSIALKRHSKKHLLAKITQ